MEDWRQQCQIQSPDVLLGNDVPELLSLLRQKRAGQHKEKALLVGYSLSCTEATGERGC